MSINERGAPAVVLTIPHAVCGTPDRLACTLNRDCDCAAKAFSIHLERALAQKGFHVVRYVSDLYRRSVDANRAMARRTAFRVMVDHAIGEADFVIDVHSFPAVQGVWGSGVSQRAPMVFLTMDEVLGYDFGHRHVDRIGAPVLVGSIENDILAQAWQNHRRPGVLVEVNESLSDEELDREARILAAAMV